MNYFKYSSVIASTKRVALVLAIFFAINLSRTSYAQEFEIGGGIGANNMMGDMGNLSNLGNVGISGPFFTRYYLRDYLNVRTNVSGGWLNASDANGNFYYQDLRAASFDAYQAGVSVMAEYHFLDFRRNMKKDKFTPYIYLGVGATVAWVQARNNTQRFEDVVITPHIPAGIGLKRKISYHFDIALETGMYLTFSDKLDGIFEGEGAVANKFSGGRVTRNDHYWFAGINLSYRFYGVKCPSPSETAY